MTQYNPPTGPQAAPIHEAPGATAGLTLGILSIVFGAPIVGLTLGIIGYYKSQQAKAYCDAYPGLCSNAGVAQGGYVCSIIGIVLGSIRHSAAAATSPSLPS